MEITRPASLGTATSGSVTFCTAKASDAAGKVRATDASVVIVADALAQGPAAGAVVVRSANARMDFMRVLSELIAADVTIGEGTVLHPGVHVQDAGSAPV